MLSLAGLVSSMSGIRSWNPSMMPLLTSRNLSTTSCAASSSHAGRLTTNRLLPDALIERLVAARLAEIT